MHLLVPYAAPLPEAGRRAASGLELPKLRALVAGLRPAGRDEGDESTLSPPHERAWAHALGWRGGDGLLPWAARQARADGIDPGSLAWGLLTPAHWHLGTEQVSLLHPASLQLDAAGSRAVFDAVRPLFEEAGWILRWGAPLRWYAAHPSLAALPTAALDRVIGRNVDAWLGKDPAARAVRRLQAEVQMLLHEHPVNTQRVARGLLPVNSFWLSGCGTVQAESGPPPQLDERLREPALAGDWPAWCAAWQSLDAGPLATLLAQARRGEPVRLTLCGERSAASWATPAPAGWLQRLLAHAGALHTGAPAAALLETL
jgi:hypothetical protein